MDAVNLAGPICSMNLGAFAWHLLFCCARARDRISDYAGLGDQKDR